ncbi:precorrin-2 dehydrogenase/sirohydrochlorin ferrochelatase family protein [Shewanella sp.]|uniref:precorrin-2 dehydrogenase/sirohydrochlorin ferrochelatase family protein n=1 Tax=Shewanella sp. TaxID=50422 RepID=UPI004054586A
MQYFPLFVDTKALSVLIVGAGEVASRKLALLARTEAIISIIAPVTTAEVDGFEAKGRINVMRRGASLEDMQGFDLIYLATADEQLNIDLAGAATQAGIWCNVVDNPKYCRFITPSIIDRGRLVVAISTAGAAPVFARSLRARLESWLPQSLAPLFDFVAQNRDKVQQNVVDAKDRRVLWEQFFELNGDRWDKNTQAHFQQAMAVSQTKTQCQGMLLLLDNHIAAQWLPLGVMPLFSQLDCIYSDITIAFELNELLRRDAERKAIPSFEQIRLNLARGERMLIVAGKAELAVLNAEFPQAQCIKAGSL